MTVEICVEDLPQALAAEAAGAHRLELCSDLSNGGLTPSYGTAAYISAHCAIPVYAMVRPRAGGFNYSKEEIEIMRHEIRALHKAGVHGVVFGVLDAAHHLDLAAMTELTNIAHDLKLEVTFHRAIDVCAEPLAAVDMLAELDVETILTSGGAAVAEDGLTRIEKMVNQANGKIKIMAGSGVNGTNVCEIIKSGVDAVHMTARKVTPAYTRLDMGQCHAPDTYKLEELFNALAK